jgi:uncharacterized protein (DUF1015 family)
LSAGYVNEFARTDSIYIADGHHRCASAVRIAERYRQLGKTGESQYFLSVLFAEDELRILPYNRVILDLNGMGTDGFTEKLGSIFDIKAADGPVNTRE